MLRWQFFLTADRDRDLSSVATATAWVQEVLNEYGWPLYDRPKPLPFPLLGTTGVAWVVARETEADRVSWKRATHALRSVAGRVAGFRGRRAEIDGLEADQVAAEYIAQSRPQLQVGTKPIREARMKLVAD